MKYTGKNLDLPDVKIGDTVIKVYDESPPFMGKPRRWLKGTVIGVREYELRIIVLDTNIYYISAREQYDICTTNGTCAIEEPSVELI